MLCDGLRWLTGELPACVASFFANRGGSGRACVLLVSCPTARQPHARGRPNAIFRLKIATAAVVVLPQPW